MKIAAIGAGPAALYFAILRKKARPRDEIVLYERNAPLQTFGWGVVFSDETLGNFEAADKPSHDAIVSRFKHWTDIDVFVKGERIRSSGHGFAGMGRRELLGVLQERCKELGVRMIFEREIEPADIERISKENDLLVGADGANSKVRKRSEKELQPSIDVRKCKYIWLGTDLRLTSFTFIFEKNEHGIFNVHAYPFDQTTSTFIVECDDETWRAAGLDKASSEESVAYLQKLFAKYLDGSKLLTNKSLWINFPTIKNERWFAGNTVLMGDAARTAHFSIGSGTKLAMEDAIALAKHLESDDLPSALRGYEMERKDASARIQKSAQDSLLFFENVKRWHDVQSPLALTFNLMTRSKRITYDNLKIRDPELVSKVRRDFNGTRGFTDVDRPPMFTPFSLRGMHLGNRVVVSPMCMYSATNGVPNDFHLVHLGARAMGGAGLVIAEMTDVSPEGRITPGCAGIWNDEQAASWKRIVDFAHERSH
ncbi:MAG TPA: FAD-dependent monooxygenase, partial [Polyangiaceae bacterium]